MHFIVKTLDSNFSRDYSLATGERGQFLGQAVVGGCGAALLGLTGGVGILIASSGGEGEVVQQVQTAAPSASIAPVVTASPSPSPSSTPTPSPSETLTYTNSIYGYSLQYPRDWFIQTDPAGYAIIASYDPATAKGVGGFPPGAFKIDITTLENPKNLTLSEWIAEFDKTSAEYDSLTVESQSEVSTPVPGIMRTVRLGDVAIREYLFQAGSGVFYMSGRPADSSAAGVFDPIVQSFKFSR